MKVILQQDVKDVGKVGEVISVSNGFARNFLFPRKFAVEATETRVAEWEHLKRVAEIKKKKAMNDRQDILTKMSGVSIKFKVSAGDSDKLFGTITTTDISRELEKLGYLIDRRDIHLEEPIRMLGIYKATVRLGEGLGADLQIIIDRA